MTLLPLLLTITTTMSIMFMFLKHPLTLGLSLILQTLLICLVSSLSTSFSWFSYILFMIFLGATLVLFIYIASLAPNEIISLSNKMITLVITPLMIIPLLMASDKELLAPKTSMELSSIVDTQAQGSPLTELSMIYNPPISNITMFIIIYLLMTLLIVVKLTSTFYGPLRLS
uniref:NADH-ubiquinone oxidoreductase chain 6 n=1 Tax=Synalpheus microneptunus TaxID=1503767 RepID=A0A6H0DSN6_9EUCA|nr:NADH dehydrogenase subunit 6 [Synalpheus microneptunus]QIS92012.1 NADH dehydrogenase subunit 6 [Synalpheus microneptunus]